MVKVKNLNEVMNTLMRPARNKMRMDMVVAMKANKKKLDARMYQIALMIGAEIKK